MLYVKCDLKSHRGLVKNAEIQFKYRLPTCNFSFLVLRIYEIEWVKTTLRLGQLYTVLSFYNVLLFRTNRLALPFLIQYKTLVSVLCKRILKYNRFYFLRQEIDSKIYLGHLIVNFFYLLIRDKCCPKFCAMAGYGIRGLSQSRP